MMIAGLSMRAVRLRTIWACRQIDCRSIRQLLAFTGLSFYGGLILGTVRPLVCRQKPVEHSAARRDKPALILAMGLVVVITLGDGDWGINPAPK